MARHTCVRCGALSFDSDGPHLCKDLARRLRRRERQVEVVVAILREGHRNHRRVAEDIVQALSGLGVQDD